MNDLKCVVSGDGSVDKLDIGEQIVGEGATSEFWAHALAV